LASKSLVHSTEGLPNGLGRPKVGGKVGVGRSVLNRLDHIVVRFQLVHSLVFGWRYKGFVGV